MPKKPKFVRFGGGGEDSRPSNDGDLHDPPVSKSHHVPSLGRKKNARENGLTIPARREK